MLHRLFYLNEETLIPYINEETLFNGLYWLNPSLSAIIVSVLLGENFLSYSESHSGCLSVWLSPCSSSIIQGEENCKFEMSFVYKVFALSHLTFIFMTVITQILLKIRQRQLEKEKVEGIMVVTYSSRDGVTISTRGPNLRVAHTLWKHNRTVVTPRASFFSFLATLTLTVFLHASLSFVMDPSGFRIFAQFISFLSFCVLFFLFSFIEAIFSPTLRNSFYEMFPWSNRAHHVITV